MANEEKTDTAALKDEIHRLVKEPSHKHFALAQKLAYLKREKSKEFDELLEERKTIKLPLSPRRIHYLVSVVETIPAPEEYPGLEAIGWTKLALIAEHLKAKGIDEPKTDPHTKVLLSKAGGISVRKLKAFLSRTELSDETPPPKERCVMMYFSEQDYARLEEVLLANGATRSGKHGLRGKEQALMKVINKIGL